MKEISQTQYCTIRVAEVEFSAAPAPEQGPVQNATEWLRRHGYELALGLIAVVVFFGCMVSPPALMDDVDASHAQLARNMLQSGDWIIPRLDGVPYIEKAPLPYWLIALSYVVFGVHDWAARIPFAFGHMGDLTLRSFAYLRAPLVLAGLAFLLGAAGAWFLPGRRAFAALAVMMILFFHASRLAMVTFDPYLSSRSLAEVLRHAPQGELIVDGDYYSFSAVFFYAGRTALLLNGRINNLEYGSHAPGAPPVFIDDAKFAQLWSGTACYYLVADGTRREMLDRLAGLGNLHPVAESGGKFLFTNHLSGPIPAGFSGTEIH